MENPSYVDVQKIMGEIYIDLKRQAILAIKNNNIEYLENLKNYILEAMKKLNKNIEYNLHAFTFQYENKSVGDLKIELINQINLLRKEKNLLVNLPTIYAIVDLLIQKNSN